MVRQAPRLGIAFPGIKMQGTGLIKNRVTLAGKIAQMQFAGRPREVKGRFQKEKPIKIKSIRSAEEGDRFTLTRIEATFRKRRHRFFHFREAPPENRQFDILTGYTPA